MYLKILAAFTKGVSFVVICRAPVDQRVSCAAIACRLPGLRSGSLFRRRSNPTKVAATLTSSVNLDTYRKRLPEKPEGAHGTVTWIEKTLR